MKKIIRLTESDLHNLVQRSVARVLREQQDNNLLLQSIAQSIAQQRKLDVMVGENDADFELGNGRFAHITFEVDSDPYMQKGMRSSSYDVPDDPDEIIDRPTVMIGSIEYCNNDGQCIPIHDNGIVQKALESIMSIDYNMDSIPSEDDYYYDE